MSKTFRPWNVDQAWLLPPSIEEFVPAGHPAHLVRDLVRESLDLGAVMAAYDEPRGDPPYHPAMMVAVLLYGYSQGVYASRRIARALEERLDFMAVSALERPDLRTISDFTKRHLAALAGLFGQILELCREAGLVALGHVALDGTKLTANASKHKAMSYGRMVRAEADLTAEIEAWLAQAEAVAAAEDAAHGQERRGDEMPDWVKDKQRRLETIRAAKAALEAKARAEAETAAGDGERCRGGRRLKHDPARPKPSAQRNFTDPESRIMKTSRGFEQCYNPQIAVDGGSHFIVATRLTNNGADSEQLKPTVQEVCKVTEKLPGMLLADSGYCCEENLVWLEKQKIDAYVSLGREGKPAPERNPELEATERMRAKLGTPEGKRRYAKRKTIPEPVFGWIKNVLGFRQFSLRGERKAGGEWNLVCLATNLLRMSHLQSAAA